MNHPPIRTSSSRRPAPDSSTRFPHTYSIPSTISVLSSESWLPTKQDTTSLPSMDCFQDFCLVCDKQCDGAVYCSQSCRLADLENANRSALPSPASSNGSAWSAALLERMAAEALQVAAQKSRTQTVKRAMTELQRDNRSTSRLSVTTTSTSIAGFTEQAHLELQEYFSSFDQTRATKRRSSVR